LKALLHGDLLIQHQPDQQRERVLLQKLVGGGILSPDDRHLVNNTRQMDSEQGQDLIARAAGPDRTP